MGWVFRWVAPLKQSVPFSFEHGQVALQRLFDELLRCRKFGSSVYLREALALAPTCLRPKEKKCNTKEDWKRFGFLSLCNNDVTSKDIFILSGGGGGDPQSRDGGPAIWLALLRKPQTWIGRDKKLCREHLLNRDLHILTLESTTLWGLELLLPLHFLHFMLAEPTSIVWLSPYRLYCSYCKSPNQPHPNTPPTLLHHERVWAVSKGAFERKGGCWAPLLNLNLPDPATREDLLS